MESIEGSLWFGTSCILEVKSKYYDWARNRFNDIDAVENEDFQGAKILAPSDQNRKE